MNKNRRGVPRVNVTVNGIRAIERKAALDGLRFAAGAMTASFVITLQDKWGWDKDAMVTLLEQVNAVFDSIDGDYVTVEDLQKTIYDELGIDLRSKKD